MVPADSGSPSALVALPYKFDPKVEAELLLASSPDLADAAAGRAIRIGQPQRHTCRHSEHHHVVFLSPERYRLTLDGRLPWTGPSYLNLALVATHQDARRGQVLLIGQNEPATAAAPAHAEGNMAKLSVIRFRGKPQPKGRTIRSKSRRATTIPIRHGDATVVRSIRLANLAPHDQLVVTAQLQTHNPHRYPARISTRIILADSRSSVDLGGHAADIASFRGEITKENGTNCLAGKSSLTRKVGVLRILKPADRPLFINHVATSADPEGGATSGDRLEVVDDGYLEVVRYRAAVAP